MSFVESIKNGFRNYANFQGLASIREYWWFVLFSFLAWFAANVVEALIFGIDASFIVSVVSLGLVLPLLAVTVRRLRDAGFSWALVFLALVPFFGVVTLFILCSMPSKTQYISKNL